MVSELSRRHYAEGKEQLFPNKGKPFHPENSHMIKSRDPIGQRGFEGTAELDSFNRTPRKGKGSTTGSDWW